ncbi:unnamed protein product [Amoebophrya sp. A25]|nr:unnamed protein product [Amoebophrya sp. A25]|eukprot:GSA25T00016557001.1
MADDASGGRAYRWADDDADRMSDLAGRLHLMSVDVANKKIVRDLDREKAPRADADLNDCTQRMTAVFEQKEKTRERHVISGAGAVAVLHGCEDEESLLSIADEPDSAKAIAHGYVGTRMHDHTKRTIAGSSSENDKTNAPEGAPAWEDEERPRF